MDDTHEITGLGVKEREIAEAVDGLLRDINLKDLPKSEVINISDSRVPGTSLQERVAEGLTLFLANSGSQPDPELTEFLEKFQIERGRGLISQTLNHLNREENRWNRSLLSALTEYAACFPEKFGGIRAVQDGASALFIDIVKHYEMSQGGGARRLRPGHSPTEVIPPPPADFRPEDNKLCNVYWALPKTSLASTGKVAILN